MFHVRSLSVCTTARRSAHPILSLCGGSIVRHEECPLTSLGLVGLMERRGQGSFILPMVRCHFFWYPSASSASSASFVAREVDNLSVEKVTGLTDQSLPCNKTHRSFSSLRETKAVHSHHHFPQPSSSSHKKSLFPRFAYSSWPPPQDGTSTLTLSEL